MSLRAVLVDDRPRFLSALERYLGRRAQVEVVGKFDSPSSTSQILRLRPDMVLVGMPADGKEVFDFIRQLKAQPDSPRVVLLIPDDIDEYRTRARDVGADGCAVETEVESQLLPLIYRFGQEL